MSQPMKENSVVGNWVVDFRQILVKLRGKKIIKHIIMKRSEKLFVRKPINPI